MTQGTINLIGSVLILWATVVGVASVWLHSRVDWRATPMGRHLMAYMAALAAALVLSSIRFLLGGDTWWFQLIRLVVFVAVPVAMTQRLLIQIRAQREVRREIAGTPSSEEPVMSYELLRREIEARFKSLWSYVLDQQRYITMMGERMAATDDLVVRLDAATNELAADLAALRDEVAGLDAGVAAKFEPLVSRLEALGQDPTNPVPEPEPSPEDNPST